MSQEFLTYNKFEQAKVVSEITQEAIFLYD